MINVISTEQATLVAKELFVKLKKLKLITQPIEVSVSHQDKFGFSSHQPVCILTLHFKNANHGADFFREFMRPLSLNHEPPASDLSVFTIRLEITPTHPLMTNSALIDKLLQNFQRSIKENYIPHQHH